MNRTLRFLPALSALALTLGAGSAAAAVHVVSQSSLTFAPATLTVTVGDTVRWVWTAGVHTVTNGADLTDPTLGTLFDAPLTTTNRSFQYRFTTTGEVPYLCRPHAGLGMTGLVRVQAPSPVPPDAARVALLPNVPNPFNPSTRIAFVVPEGMGTEVELDIYDGRGRLVRTLLRGSLPTGEHRVVWDGRDDGGAAVGSGIYLCRLEADGVASTRAVTLLK